MHWIEDISVKKKRKWINIFEIWELYFKNENIVGENSTPEVQSIVKLEYQLYPVIIIVHQTFENDLIPCHSILYDNKLFGSQ